MDGVAAVVNGIGLMALLASVFGVLLRARLRPALRDVALGLLFGLFAGMPGLAPSGGAHVEPQLMLVGFAAAFLSLSGLAVAGVLAFAVQAVVAGGWPDHGHMAALLAGASSGLLWSLLLPVRWQGRPGAHALLGFMVAIGTLIPAASLPLPLPGTPGWVPGLWMLAACPGVLMALVMGAMVARERAQATREAALATEARTDALTGLANRRALEAAYAAVADRWPAEGVAVLLFDLDRFKQINDRFGHEAGDAVLRVAAAAFDAARGGAGTLVRLGGEEFALLLPGVRQGAAAAVAEAARATLAGLAIRAPGAGDLRMTVSIGVAWSPVAAPLATLLKAADTAMYAAKSAGRNAVRIAGQRTGPAGLPAAPRPQAAA